MGKPQFYNKHLDQSFTSLSPKFDELYRISEEKLIPNILEQIQSQILFTNQHFRNIHQTALSLVNGIRQQKIRSLGIENFLQTYHLGSQEGLALMCLAEAYLRIPDENNQKALILDKIGTTDWAKNIGKADSTLMNLATFWLSITEPLMDWGIDRKGFIGALASLSHKLTTPMIRQAVHSAMELMGHQFVLGEKITEALKKARKTEQAGYFYSFDMLGESARTAKDAQRYFESYRVALQAMACNSPSLQTQTIFERPSLSVKLSALHPRYELLQKKRAFDELLPRLYQLCQEGKTANLGLTLDAEESERLELSLELLEELCKQKDLIGWDGLGLAVQAYQKRATAVIDWISLKAKQYERRFCVRLVKGAYWDTEIKRTQELGLEDYPVFTRKENTDLNYILCAAKMFKDPKGIYPQFATHNALTVAVILELSQIFKDNLSESSSFFEFQRLHGMGEQLYSLVVSRKDLPFKPTCRIYAPVGPHRDLLAYLVRRLLENGANSSFVNQVFDKSIPAESLIENPIYTISQRIDQGELHHHSKIPLPQHILLSRTIGKGIDLSSQETLNDIQRTVSEFSKALPIMVS